MKHIQTLVLKSLSFILLFSVILSLQFCKSTNVSTKPYNDVKGEPLISYNTTISPIMTQKCTPCHYPERGKKKLLDTYVATKNNIEDILVRVQLPENHEDFMPYKLKREPLTETEIELMKKWMSTGMAK